MLFTRSIREVLPATPRARIVRIDLDGSPFPFLPGQAVLISAHGHGQPKPYSIAGSPEETERHGWLELLIGCDAEGRAAPHLPLEAGMLVDVEGPMGGFTFPADPEERRFLFIAGGTGISPLRSMLRHALTVPHESIGLLFSARSPGEFAYEHEFRSLAQAGEIELQLKVTREPAQDGWTGSHGRVGRADLEALVHDRETLCFVCGPPTLVREMRELLEELSVARQRIRKEDWG